MPTLESLGNTFYLPNRTHFNASDSIKIVAVLAGTTIIINNKPHVLKFFQEFWISQTGIDGDY
jgi:hypothetical protein